MQDFERQLSDLQMQIHQIEVESKLKLDDNRKLAADCDVKRVELTKLAASRNQVKQCQEDFDSAKKSNDEFMESYSQRSNDLKRQIKEISDQIRDLQEKISNDDKLLQDLSLHRREVRN